MDINRPGQGVAVDTTPLPVKVLDDVFAEPITVDLTLALDAHSHSPVAYRLTPVSDASIEVAMLLRDILLPLPIREDWGQRLVRQALQEPACVATRRRLLPPDGQLGGFSVEFRHATAGRRLAPLKFIQQRHHRDHHHLATVEVRKRHHTPISAFPLQPEGSIPLRRAEPFDDLAHLRLVGLVHRLAH
ncbi:MULTISPECIES: hypothetical protein [unclassified Streptomyces]|uniref:hypothetical protein n=1 Tax=unclassified Streptomyces TaxID=2593676 RepID=UPI000DC430C3|nr:MULTISPECIES: hypothetical protein [unclassified Streptomyces]MYT69658.1 hypothetical protein [Streptomyces sp. SID8367]RAJ70722.1 hypothetical protein K377_07798 [Streptomyces sp. PsTaAH-137]